MALKQTQDGTPDSQSQRPSDFQKKVEIKEMTIETEIYEIWLEAQEGGGYTGKVPSLGDGCTFEGETIEEALENGKEVILLWREMDEQGDKLSDLARSI